MSFVFEIVAKNPPSILFALAAFTLALSSYYADEQKFLLPWVSNFFWAGIILQLLWVGFQAWENR